MLILFLGGLVALGVTAGLSLWPNLIASLLYQHNLIYGHGSAINGVAWSLEVEVQFYLLAPLFAAVFSIQSVLARRAVLLGAMSAAPLLRGLFPAAVSERFGLSLPWFLEFLWPDSFSPTSFSWIGKSAPVTPWPGTSPR